MNTAVNAASMLAVDSNSDSDTIQVATTFHSGANLDGPRAPDVVLHSMDDIYFYVHSHVVLEASGNAFGGLMSHVNAALYALPIGGSHENSLSLGHAGADPYFLTQSDVTVPFNDFDVLMNSIVDDSQMSPSALVVAAPNDPTSAGDSSALASSVDPYGSFTNEFGTTPRLEPLPVVDVPERATVLNAILHVAYSLPISDQPQMEWGELVDVVNAMIGRYAFSLPRSSPLFPVIMAHAAARPLDVFALATEADADELAAASSQYLLSLAPEGAQDLVSRIRTPYLMRLIALLYGRVDELRRIAALSLPLHAPADRYVDCSEAVQNGIRADWNIAVAQVIADARPDSPGSVVESAFGVVLSSSPCYQCSADISNHIQTLVQRWAAVKRTI